MRVRYGKPTIATVDIRAPDGTVDSASRRDRGARPADRRPRRLDRRRRRQSGPADRALRRGLLLPPLPRRGAQRIFPSGPRRLQRRQGLRRRHRRPDAAAASRLGAPRRALDVGRLPPLALRLSDAHRARARDREPARRGDLPAARLHRRDDRRRLARLAARAANARRPARCAGTVPAQIAQLQDALDTRAQADSRAASSISCCSPSAPTTSSSPASSPTSSSAPRRARAVRPGRPDRDGRRRRSASSTATCPRDFAKLRAALKPMVGGNLSRVVFVSYGHPALRGRRALPRRPRRLRRASGLHRRRRRGCAASPTSCERKFLPTAQGARALRGRRALPQSGHRPHDLRRCPSGRVRRARRLRARRQRSGVRPRMLLGRRARASRPIRSRPRPRRWPASLRPSEFRPYAPRARWIRTANDSYFTAMTYPARAAGDAAAERHPRRDLGRDVSAVYGGAIHPTAEGHAAMADAALPAVRAGARPDGAARGDRRAAAAAGPRSRSAAAHGTQPRSSVTPRRASSAGWSTTSCTGTSASCPDRRSGAPSATSARPRGSRTGSA